MQNQERLIRYRLNGKLKTHKTSSSPLTGIYAILVHELEIPMDDQGTDESMTAEEICKKYGITEARFL